MVLDHPVDRKQNASSHYSGFQLKNGQSKQISNSSKLPERNTRHYKSSLVLNCAPTNGPSTASPSCSSPMAIKDGPSVHGLPRLANALKSLISSTGINASFKTSKSAFIDAGDEVIYYSNVPAPIAGGVKSSNNGGASQQRKSDNGEMANKALRRSPSLNSRIDKCGNGHGYTRQDEYAIDENDDEEGKQFSASSSSHYFAHRQPTTLEQIRQLYKSVPNFSSFDDCEEEENEGNNSIGGQPLPISSRKFEARIGRLCPANANNGNENPPPLIAQRKRLQNAAQSAQKCVGIEGKVSAKSALSCGTPSSSAASSLSSSNSARSMPAVQTNNNGEQVAEQCEKMVKPTRQIKSNLSLASCSLESNSSAGNDGKNASKIVDKKFSPTDSGYRSRGETPKGNAVGGLNSRGRPQSMIYPNTEFDYVNQRGEGKAGNGHHFSQIYSPKRPQQEKEYMRKYIWTEKVIYGEAINKWPFTESEFEEWIDGNLEGMSKLLYKTFTELAKKIWEELRRLTGVLVKCTLRDICTVVLLIFPPQIAWQCISNGTKSVKYLEKSLNGNEATKMTISERARLQYFRAGQFLRWMLETKMATIVDEKSATFLAAIFDSLLHQFIQLLKTEQKGENWNIKLKDCGLLNVLAEFKPFTKSIHILRPLPSDQSSLFSFADILHNLPLSKLIFTGEFPHLEAEMFGENRGSNLAFGNSAVLALHFWLNCSEHCEKLMNDLEDWARKATIFAIHRCANLIEENDVLQAARLILPNFDCPPLLTDHFNLDANFSVASKAIILGRNKILEDGEDGILRKKSPNLWPEFVGWTPFCWAIALENVELVEEMLQRRPAICREVRNHTEPLKICAQIGNLEICELLLRHGANPFTKSSNSSSPFAIAAARANVRMLEMFMKCSVGIRPNNSNKQMLLLMGENDEKKKKNIGPQNEWNLFPKFGGSSNVLSENEKRAFSDAIWLAAETDQMEIILQLKKAITEIAWPNSGIWLQCLEWLIGQMDKKISENVEKDLMELLGEFGPKMGEELMVEPRGQQRTELLAKLLFKLLSNPSLMTTNSRQRIRALAARHLSTQFQLVQKGSLCQLEREFSAYFPGHFATNDSANSPHSAIHLPPQIDPKFVDCPDLSDIRFRFADGQIVFAHRIVLVNASEQFRQILRSPSGVVEVPNANAEVFRLLLEFAYGNLAICSGQIGKMRSEQQIHLIELARRFGLEKLVEIGQKALGTGLRSVDGFQRIYKLAKEFELLPLMEDCERFGLANLPELMALFGGGEGQEWKQLLAKMSVQFRMALRESRI